MTNYYQPMYGGQQYPSAYPDRLSQLQQQQYVPPMQSPAPPQQQGGLIWIQGESAARSFLVAPNSTVMLMDSDGDYFYIKSADSAGMPTLRTFAYKEVTGQQQTTQVPQQQDMTKQFVTREEYDKLVEIIRRMAEERKGVISDAEQPAL